MGKTRRRKGGVIIDKGGNSIILYPPPKCKNKSNLEDYVGKITLTRSGKSLPEIDPKLLRILKKIDPDQKYLYYPEKCDVDDETIEENKEYNLKKDNIEIVRKGKDKWFDWKHRKDWKVPSEDKLEHLKKAIYLLHDNKIVHGDFSGANVIYGKDDMPRIIDFTEAVYESPKDYIDQEKEFIERAWPKLDLYAMYRRNTKEGKKIDAERTKYKNKLLKTRRKIIA